MSVSTTNGGHAPTSPAPEAPAKKWPAVRVRLEKSSLHWIAKWRDAGAGHRRRVGELRKMTHIEAQAAAHRVERQLRATAPESRKALADKPGPRVRLKSNGGYWQAAITDEGGRHIRSLGPKSKMTEEQAREQCRLLEYELSKQVADGLPGALGEMRLGEWIRRRAGQRSHLAAATREIDGYCAEYLLRHFWADPLLRDITRAQGAEWRAALASGELHTDNDRHCGVPADNTVCKHVRCAKKLFADALDQDLITQNPFDRLRGNARRQNKTWEYLDRGKMQLIFDACPDANWRMLFGLCRFAGLRLGEALRLRWGDIDWDRNWIHVNAGVETIDTKHRPRKPPIEPLNKIPTGLTRMMLDALDVAGDGADLVCGGGIRGDCHVRCRRIIEKAGIQPYGKILHTLRKNWEQDLAAVYPQHVVCEWQGHGIEVSDEHYLRVPEELYLATPQPEAQAPAKGKTPCNPF